MWNTVYSNSIADVIWTVDSKKIKRKKNNNCMQNISWNMLSALMQGSFFALNHAKNITMWMVDLFPDSASCFLLSFLAIDGTIKGVFLLETKNPECFIQAKKNGYWKIFHHYFDKEKENNGVYYCRVTYNIRVILLFLIKLCQFEYSISQHSAMTW